MFFCLSLWDFQIAHVSIVCFLLLSSHTVFLLRIHSWGDSLEEAFEQCAMGMFGYMTDTECVEPIDTVDVESEGECQSLCLNNNITKSLKL